MANNSPIVAPPSAVPGNLKGTLAGLAATIAVAALAKTSVFASAAALLASSGLSGTLALALGAVGFPVASTQPELVLAALAAVIVGYAVNYGVTHVSGIKTCADLYAALPQTYAEYPDVRNAPTGATITNLRTKDGRVNAGAGK